MELCELVFLLHWIHWQQLFFVDWLKLAISQAYGQQTKGNLPRRNQEFRIKLKDWLVSILQLQCPAKELIFCCITGNHWQSLAMGNYHGQALHMKIFTRVTFCTNKFPPLHLQSQLCDFSPLCHNLHQSVSTITITIGTSRSHFAVIKYP